MSTNVTVSNISPTLSYIPRTLWFEGSADDPELSSYINQSYHATNGTLGQASVSFTWYGSGKQQHHSIYGGYRQRLGPYEVVLDGKATPFPGFTGGPEQVPAVLFSESGLQPVEHQIQVINTGQDPQMSVLDINYLVMETPAAQVMTLDDSGVGYSWLPSGSQAWESDSQSHTTHNSVASVQLSFMVSISATLYVTELTNNAPFSVSIDGKLTQTLYTNTQLAPLVNTSHLLYSSLGLVSGSHTLLIQNNPLSASNATLDVDYALVLYDPASPEPTS
ncbi:hypothetical protein OBBRIDRAFT_726913 [Obba rivulosa]|uniref:Uncharacterized protein n=1 Tax=Obba rivulosa TaxID=1052685 RepID=A0A8E2AWK9_9APHY|nr:hypothetical protein OBBRIDRAFT_726913 [Obba rivulosa]